MADLNADEFYLKLIKNLQLPGKAGLTELYQLYDQAVAHYEATHILNERKCVAGENVKGESPVVELNSTVDISESVDSELELVGEPKEKRPDSVGKKEAEVTIKPVKTELMKKVQSASSISKSGAAPVTVKRTSTEATLASSKSTSLAKSAKGVTAAKPLFTLIDVDFTTATEEISQEPTRKKAKLNQKNNIVISDSDNEDEESSVIKGSRIGVGDNSDKKLLKGEIISADQLAEDAGLACAVCRLVNTSSDNRLVECTECHQLYHQLCHEPKIANANDSRLVWYCASCSKKLKKTTVTPVTNVVKPNGSESKVDSKSTKEATKDKFAGLTSTSADATQLFKRVDLTKGSQPSSSGSGNSGGLATLAASFLAKQKSSQIASVPKPTGSSVKLPTATASGSGTAVKTTSSGSATLKFSPAAVASRLATGTSVIKSGSSVMASSGGIKSTSTTGSTNASHVASVIKKPTLVGGKSTPAASATPMTNANKKLQQMKKAAEKRAFKP